MANIVTAQVETEHGDVRLAADPVLSSWMKKREVLEWLNIVMMEMLQMLDRKKGLFLLENSLYYSCQ